MKYPYEIGDKLVVVNNPDNSYQNGLSGVVTGFDDYHMLVLLEGEDSPGYFSKTTFRYATKLDEVLK